MSQAGITTPKSGGGGSGVQTLTGNSGGPVGPTGNNINVIGAGSITVTGTPGTSTLTITSSAPVTDLHITPYIVSAGGTANGASFTTIQAAVNAANAAGGGLVWVQTGTYTENLTLFSNITIIGDSEQNTFIVGTHTPPSSGTLNLFRCTFQGTTAILSSAAAGTTAIIMEDSTVKVSNGFSFDLLNWVSPGSVAVDNIGPFGANDGFFRNTGGASFFCFGAGVGNGTANAMVISGAAVFLASDITCPINFQTGASFTADSSTFAGSLILSNNSTGSINNCRITTGSAAAITMSSSGSLELAHVTINSTNNPAIAGAGAGTLTYSDISFLNNAAFAGTLTLGSTSWQPYAKAAASSVATNVGTASFNSAQFTVDANGFVSAAGAGIPTTITGNSGGALAPTGNNWNIFGSSVAAGTTPVTTVGAGSTLTVNVQRAQAIGATNASNVGLAAFNSAQFTVDGNGFVSTNGTGVANTITGNSGGALSPTAGNWNILGAATAAGTTPVTTSGSGSTLTVDVQTSQAIASTNANNIGLAAFNSAQFTVDANGFVSALSTAMVWSDKSTNFAAVVGNGYFVTATATATLPASPSQGNTIEFVVDGTGILTIKANTGEIIRIGATVSATAGTAVNNARGDSVTLVFRSAISAWIATSVIGTWTVT